MNATTATTATNRRSQFQDEYLKLFDTKNAALDWMRVKNRANRMPRWVFVVVSHPDDQQPWAVVDLQTAIELGAGYIWEV